MLKNYLKTAVRNLLRNKFYSFINISGLAVGLATCLLIWLYVSDELSYDRYNLHADRIYRVNTEIKYGNNFIDLAVAVPEMGDAMVHELPGVSTVYPADLAWGHPCPERRCDPAGGARCDCGLYAFFSL